MTIRDADKFMEGVWDWGILRGCFGESRIEPSDLDGIAERRGKFLILETKRPGVSVPLGQQILFEAMRRTGLCTIFIVWGERNRPHRIQVMTRHKIHDPTPCDVEKLRSHVKAWYRFADKASVLVGKHNSKF